MQPTKSTRRRLDLRRMKRRARRIYAYDTTAKNAIHLKKCSCWMCGNPRKRGERPVSERRST